MSSDNGKISVVPSFRSSLSPFLSAAMPKILPDVPKDRQANNLSKKGAPNMEPLPEMPSYDDLASSGVESWLDSSSKYHSCEIVDED